MLFDHRNRVQITPGVVEVDLLLFVQNAKLLPAKLLEKQVIVRIELVRTVIAAGWRGSSVHRFGGGGILSIGHGRDS